MFFLSKSYKFFLDRAIDPPGYGKYIVDGFNDVQKQHLATCFMMHSTPEVYRIDSKCMRVDAMKQKG